MKMDVGSVLGVLVVSGPDRDMDPPSRTLSAVMRVSLRSEEAAESSVVTAPSPDRARYFLRAGRLKKKRNVRTEPGLRSRPVSVQLNLTKTKTKRQNLLSVQLQGEL